MTGKGTVSGKLLGGFITEIEAIEERMKQQREARAAIYAEAKSKGFDNKTIRKIIIRRRQPSAEVQEAEHLLDTYMHAIGMAEEPPLFVALGKAGVDIARREEAMEFLKTIVPPNGEIILKVGGIPIRAWRDADGNAHASDVVEEPKPRKADEDEEVYAAPGPSRRGPPVDAVKAAADRAEAAAKEKRAREAAPTA